MTLTRSTALRTTLRERKCVICTEKFKQVRVMQKVCSAACAAVHSRQEREKQERKETRERKAAERADRVKTKQELEKFKTKGQWIAEVQAIFNAIVRIEDRDLPCISCNRFVVDDGRPGGVWDAGHYLSRGSSAHLRFDRRNVHKQCKGCNRPNGTTRTAFRAGMIARIGLAELEALEADQETRHYTIPELKQMKADLSAKLRALKETA